MSFLQMMLGGNQNKKTISLTPDDFTSKNLEQKELEKIVSMYGVEIEDIYDLSAGQKWMFRKVKSVKTTFFLQVMLKALIKLDPAEFRAKVDDITKKRDNLRSAYVFRGLDHPYRVVLKDRQTELRFKDISDVPVEELDDKLKRLMEADRNRGFDLEFDSLLRITIYKTCQPDYYAIIISQPHINSDGMSLSILMQDLFLGFSFDFGSMGQTVDSLSYKNYAKWLNSIDTESELEYWKGIMKDAPELRELPGHITNSMDFIVDSYIKKIEPELADKLTVKQKEFGATQFNFLQTAWGIMLNKMYGTNDVTYAAITAGRDAQVAGSSSIAGGFIGVIPVRLSVNEGDDTKALVKKIQKQFGYSMMKSHCSPDDIERAVGRNDHLFNHILNCHNFSSAPEDISKLPKLPGIEFMGIEAYDNLSEDLCIYILPQREGLLLNFAYNKNAFSEDAIMLLADCYEDVLKQICDYEGIIPYEDITVKNMDKFDEISEQVEKQLIRKKDFIKSIPAFAMLDDETLNMIAERSEVFHFNQDEVIIGKNQEKQDVMFVYSGHAAIYGEGSNGWMSPNVLMIKRTKDLISAVGIIPGEKSVQEIAAVDDNSQILSIPREVVWNCIQKHPEIAIEFMRSMEKEKNKIAFLWLSAD